MRDLSAGGVRPAVLLAWAAAFVIGCSSDPPAARLSISPERGVAPELVRLDASGSMAADPDAPELSARFDFDGDGTFDTDFGALTVEHEYSAAGVFSPRVEIKDAAGKTAVAAGSVEIVENRPPQPALSITPEGGKAPLMVTADARASTDPNESADNLEARFDFDGDGNFDTEFSKDKSAAHTYHAPGTYTQSVEVRDSRDLRAVLRAKAIVVLPSADLDVDSNRDGRIDDLDDAGEESWSRERGAVMLGNFDDDDGDGLRDLEDSVVSGTEDVFDLAALIVRRHESIAAGDEARVTVAPESAAYVRIFRDREGVLTELIAPGAGTAVIPSEDLAAGEVTLRIEATAARSFTWDGTASITLAIVRGMEREEDTVAIKTSPLLFQDNLQPAEILYVMKIDDFRYGENMAFYNALRDNVPEGVTIYDVDQYTYDGDRWVQDNMQTGYQAMPVEGGVYYMQTYLETERPTGRRGLEYLVTRELLGGELGYVYQGGRDTSLNYGGNLEIAPAHAARGIERPFGRLLIGGGDQGTLGGRAYEDHMTPAQRELLEAQPQGPAVELSTEWLAVGHIDEIFQFVPDRSGMSQRPFKVVLASPALARRALEELSNEGSGATVVFEGRQAETTVDDILADDQLMALVDSAQARVDGVREKLKGELELTDEDFVEVPVMYETYLFDGFDFAAAYNPGIQNLVTTRETLFIPDPEGPDKDGADVWQNLTRAVLEPLGLTVHFVDVWVSYHEGLGEAHCGTEIRHAPHEARWWEQE